MAVVHKLSLSEFSTRPQTVEDDSRRGSTGMRRSHSVAAISEVRRAPSKDWCGMLRRDSRIRSLSVAEVADQDARAQDWFFAAELANKNRTTDKDAENILKQAAERRKREKEMQKDGDAQKTLLAGKEDKTKEMQKDGDAQKTLLAGKEDKMVPPSKEEEKAPEAETAAVEEAAVEKVMGKAAEAAGKLLRHKTVGVLGMPPGNTTEPAEPAAPKKKGIPGMPPGFAEPAEPAEPPKRKGIPGMPPGFAESAEEKPAKKGLPDGPSDKIKDWYKLTDVAQAAAKLKKSTSRIVPCVSIGVGDLRERILKEKRRNTVQ